MKRIVIIVLLLVAIIAVIVLMRGNEGGIGNQADMSPVPTESAVSVTQDFYQQWLAASRSATATPDLATLLAANVVSDAVREYVVSAEADGVTNPILCQVAVPERIRVAEVLVEERTAELQIFARGDNLQAGDYALVELAAVDGAWQIQTVGCYSGESAPEREFTFEQSGQLLKSVPAPLDSNRWHLVFAENGGGFVPLFFSETSLCTTGDSESVCNPDSFTEASRVTIQGQMSESGVDVVRVLQ